eukprot:1189828-Prorocentrum_minimum.AAC.3
MANNFEENLSQLLSDLQKLKLEAIVTVNKNSDLFLVDYSDLEENQDSYEAATTDAISLLTSPKDPDPELLRRRKSSLHEADKKKLQHSPHDEGVSPSRGGFPSPSSSSRSGSPGDRAASSSGTSRSGNAKHEHDDDVSSKRRENSKRLKTSRRSLSHRSALQPGAVYKGTICIPGNPHEIEDQYLMRVLEWDEVEDCLIVSHSAYGDTQLCHMEVCHANLFPGNGKWDQCES